MNCTLLTSRAQLVRAIEHQVNDPKERRLPCGTVQCCARNNTEIFFMTQVRSVGNQRFENGAKDDGSMYWKYQPPVAIEFVGEKVVAVWVSERELDLDQVILSVFDEKQ